MRSTVVSYDGGRTTIEANLGTAHGLLLYRYGVSDPEIDLVAKFLRPGDAFVDGGANIGLYTLVAARRVHASGRVLAFEPSPATAGCLRANVLRNGLHNVEVHETALYDRSGTADFVCFEGDAIGLSSFAPQQVQGGRRVQVSLERLDDVLQGRDRERVTFVKLDLEGAECAALSGAAHLLESPRPDFLVEMEAAQLQRHGGSPFLVSALFANAGYHAYCVERHGADDVCVIPCSATESPCGKGPNVLFSARPDRLMQRGVKIAGANRTG